MVNFRILNEDDIEKIKEAALDILQNTGFQLEHKGALELLERNGAKISGNRVKVPKNLTIKCIDTTPKKIDIYNRNKELKLEIVGKKSYFGTSTASPNTRDYKTGKIRETTVKDIEIGAKLGDALQNIDFIMPMGSAQDVPPNCAELYEFQAAVTNTTKPVVFYGYSPEGVKYIYDMATEIAGDLEELRKKPFLINYPEPVSPLTMPTDVVEKMLYVSSLGLPQIPGSTVQPGVTSPVTLGGAIAQLIAEGLMSLVIIQLKNPGAPCFLSGNLNIFDMKTTLMSIAAPEMSLGIGAQAEVARSWGLPTWGLAGSTDSKLLDAQAGIESTYSLLVQALAGLNIIHDVGYMDMAMVCSAEMLVMGDEIIGMVKRLLDSININEKTLATDLINKVGPGGDFLKQMHTMKNFRSELWRPTLFTRDHISIWKKKGSKSINELIQEKIDHILTNHVVDPLPQDIIQKLEVIKMKGRQKILKSRDW